MEQVKTGSRGLINSTILRSKVALFGVSLWALCYVLLSFVPRPDATAQTSSHWILLAVFTTAPVAVVVCLFAQEWKGGELASAKTLGRLVKVAAAVAVATLFLDVLGSRLNWGSIAPGSWSTFGLMLVCVVFVTHRFGLSTRTVLVAVMGAFLFVAGWEMQYLARYTAHFWGEPLSWKDTVMTWVPFLIPLVLAVAVYAYYRIRPTVYTWLWLGVAAGALCYVVLSGYFSVAWSGNGWVSNEPDYLVFALNRVSKVAVAFAVVSLSYGGADA